MLQTVIPKLPTRDISTTRKYYIGSLGFSQSGDFDEAGYLILEKDDIEIHFFLFKELDPKEITARCISAPTASTNGTNIYWKSGCQSIPTVISRISLGDSVNFHSLILIIIC